MKLFAGVAQGDRDSIETAGNAQSMDGLLGDRGCTTEPCRRTCFAWPAYGTSRRSFCLRGHESSRGKLGPATFTRRSALLRQWPVLRWPHRSRPKLAGDTRKNACPVPAAADACSHAKPIEFGLRRAMGLSLWQPTIWRPKTGESRGAAGGPGGAFPEVLWCRHRASITPSDLITRGLRSENAISVSWRWVDHQFGLHCWRSPHAGVPSASTFETIRSGAVICLVLSPAAASWTVDLHNAAVSQVMKLLLDAGLLHGDCPDDRRQNPGRNCSLLCPGAPPRARSNQPCLDPLYDQGPSRS